MCGLETLSVRSKALVAAVVFMEVVTMLLLVVGVVVEVEVVVGVGVFLFQE